MGHVPNKPDQHLHSMPLSTPVRNISWDHQMPTTASIGCLKRSPFPEADIPYYSC